MIWTEKTIWFGILTMLFLFGLFGDKPVHVDEANFLALTSGDIFGPHSILINWEGKKEKAFAVLSNPPGIAWYLWPVKRFDVHLLRWAMFPWAILGVLGSYLLGESWAEKGKEVLLLWLVSPFLSVSGNALMPDMPMFALCSLGGALLITGRYIHLGAFLCGMSALFRYSGLCMIPLVLAWGVLHRPSKCWSLAIAVLFPSVCLFLHDLLAYQQWHFWHMISFQSETRSAEQLLAQFGACFAMMFGGFVCCIPLRIYNIRIWAFVSCSAGIFIALMGWTDLWDIWHYGFWGVGFSLLLHAVIFFWKRKEFWLLLWLCGAVVFLLNLRFMATRYWVPFVIPILLFVADQNTLRRLVFPAILSSVLSLSLAWDDYSLAKAQYNLSQKVDDIRRDVGCEEAYFSGHWGWQYHLHSRGWESIEEDQQLSSRVCSAFSEHAWPQEFGHACAETVVYVEDQVLLPIRVHSRDSRSNYHSNYLSGVPVQIGFAPWGIGFDPWDRVHFSKSCTRF